MTKEELIEQEAFKHRPNSKLLGDNVARNNWIAGINSTLAKDFQELAVIDGRISECDEQLGFNYILIKHNENTPYGKDFCSAIHAVNAKALFNRTKLEITRTELLKRLNLEG